MTKTARFSPAPPLLLPWVLLLLCACSTDGAKSFRDQGCIHCHSFQGEGGNMGPELTAVTARRSDDWIRQYLKNPQAMNPDARMPPFPLLSSRERQEIIEYLKR